MKLGIKVAANPDDIERFKLTGAKYCEVRFVVEEKERFTDLLDYIKKQNIQPNFHYWAAFDGILANPAAPGELGEQTVETIKQTIEVAAKHQASYVVIHPGQTKKNKINHRQRWIRPLETIITIQEAETLLLKRLKFLTEFAEKQGIQLLTETITPLDPYEWMTAEGRKMTVNIGSLSLSSVEKIAEAGFPIANDFEHTAGNKISNDHQTVFSFLYQKTVKLASFTKLLHLGYIIPPYNGTDYHGNFSDPEFTSPEALPNKDEMLKLLQIFKDRDDVWVIPEPATDHVGSYRVAQELLREI